MTGESPLDCKEIKPVHPKGNQSQILIGRTDAEAETPILWPSDAKSWLIWKDPDAGKGWRQEKGRQRMRWLDGITDSMDMSLGKLQELVIDREPYPCCSPWGRRVGHDWVTELNCRIVFLFFLHTHSISLHLNSSCNYLFVSLCLSLDNKLSFLLIFVATTMPSNK